MSPIQALSEPLTGIEALSSIKTATLHTQVYDSLSEALMSGAFSPGEKLSYQKIAQQFGVSPMPVRDALRRLAAEGAVEISPKRGVRIPQMTRVRLDELACVRPLLEGVATELAGPNIDRQALNDLDALAHAMIADAKAEHWHDYLARNQRFHFNIYYHSGSALLNRLIGGLWLQTGPMMRHFSANGLEGSISLHYDIIDAMRGGDFARARALMEEDVRDGMEYLRDFVTEAS